MAQYPHKGQILPLVNQMIPIDKQTTFHASYDYHLNGYNQGNIVYPLGATKATKFDGSTGAIDIMPVNSVTNQFTIEFWINPPNTTSAKQIAGQAGSFGVVKNNTGIKIVMWANDWQTSYMPAANTWTHVAAVYDGANRYLYFNGVLQGSTATTGNVPTSSYKFCIGRWDTMSSTENYPDSTLYDVRLWNVARSQISIQNNMYKSLIGNETGLLGNWKLSETGGSVYFDSSINANSGVKVGTLTPAYGPTIATLQSGQGKFGGAVSIEPDTTNIWNQKYAWSLPADGATIPLSYSITTSTNGWYTLSCWIKYYSDDTSTSPRTTLIINYTDGTNDQIKTSDAAAYNYFHIKDGQWRYFKLSLQANSSKTVSSVSGWIFDHSTPGSAKHCEAKNIQIEMRDYPTSFVAGSRPLGKLWYPKELINLPAFTVSCWFNVPYVPRIATMGGGIKGGWWYGPIIELAPQTASTNPAFSVVVDPHASGYSYTTNLRFASNTDATHDGVTQIQDSTWYHMVLTYDGTNYKLYINGTLEVTAAYSIGTVTSDTVLMVGGGWCGKPFTWIDELRIESRAISSDEAVAWAASGLHYNYLDYSQYVN